MSNKLKEYTQGRMDGLTMAERLVKEGGLEALQKEIQTRGRMNIHTGLTMKELDSVTEHIKEATIETVRIASISILHDVFGFGQVRCTRFLNAYDKISAYLHNGWTTWMDLIETIKHDLNLEMEYNMLSDLKMTGKFGHPEPEDIYGEQDLIDESLWQELLKELNFKEESIGKGKYQIMMGETPILQYEGMYNKIQMYDVLTGMLIAKTDLGWK